MSIYGVQVDNPPCISDTADHGKSNQLDFWFLFKKSSDKGRFTSILLERLVQQKACPRYILRNVHSLLEKITLTVAPQRSHADQLVPGVYTGHFIGSTHNNIN